MPVIGGISSAGNSTLYELVQSYMSLERQPLTALQAQRSELDSRNSGFNDLKSKLRAVRSAIEDFRWTGSLTPINRFSALSSNEVALSAVIDGSATAGTHVVSIGSLARAHSVASAAFVGEDPFTASGSYSFQLVQGGESHTVEVDLAEGLTSGEALREIASHINASGASLRATVVTSNTLTGEQRMLLTSLESGTPGIISEISDLTGDLAALTGLAGVSSGTSFSENTVQEASDATLTVNGLALVSSSNQIEGALPGITINLLAEADTPVSVSVEREVEVVRTSIDEFIGVYNELVDFVRAQTRTSDAEGQNRGAFTGNNTFMGLRRYLRSLATDPVGDLVGGDVLSRLAEIGITSDQTGRLSVSDETLFEDALSTRASEVERLFREDEDGVAVRMVNLIDRYVGGKGLIAGESRTLTTRRRYLDQRIDRMETRLARREEALTKELASLQAMITSLTGQGNALDQLIGGYS